MEEERICALCGEKLEDDDEGRFLKDGRLVCDCCAEFRCAVCDECEELVEEDEMTFWGEDCRLCPECYEKYFPPYDEKKVLEETQKAYEGMLKRLIGKKTDREAEDIFIETDMNDDAFKYEITVSVDQDGRICDISRYRAFRCASMSERSESWVDYPVRPSVYDKDGPAEDLIRSRIEISDEEE